MITKLEIINEKTKVVEVKIVDNNKIVKIKNILIKIFSLRFTLSIKYTNTPEAIIPKWEFSVNTFKLNVKEVSRKNAQEPPSLSIEEISWKLKLKILTKDNKKNNVINAFESIKRILKNSL